MRIHVKKVHNIKIRNVTKYGNKSHLKQLKTKYTDWFLGRAFPFDGGCDNNEWEADIRVCIRVQRLNDQDMMQVLYQIISYT